MRNAINVDDRKRKSIKQSLLLFAVCYLVASVLLCFPTITLGVYLASTTCMMIAALSGGHALLKQCSRFKAFNAPVKESHLSWMLACMCGFLVTGSLLFTVYMFCPHQTFLLLLAQCLMAMPGFLCIFLSNVTKTDEMKIKSYRLVGVFEEFLNRRVIQPRPTSFTDLEGSVADRDVTQRQRHARREGKNFIPYQGTPYSLN